MTRVWDAEADAEMASICDAEAKLLTVKKAHQQAYEAWLEARPGRSEIEALAKEIEDRKGALLLRLQAKLGL